MAYVTGSPANGEAGLPVIVTGMAGAGRTCTTIDEVATKPATSLAVTVTV